VSRDERELLRALPAVDELVRTVAARPELRGVSRARLTATARDVVQAERRALLDGRGEAADTDTLVRRIVEALAGGRAWSLRPVINATGVVLHTNLGRAVLPEAAIERMTRVGSSYANLELDLATKTRGSRYSHVEMLLQRITGAEDALVVNNNAAAVLLALETLASGREVIVSRGELIEIGGEFRIPDILRRSGARLREVGATNRTHRRDYVEAIGPDTALLLKVHTSNYRVIGFTAEVPARELVEIGRERGIPVLEDLGSGCFVDLRRWGFPYEPTVPEVVASGVDLVTFSGDKLLGGPQAGIVVGTHELVSRLERNPLNRALRIDKLTLAALEATLAAYEAGDAVTTIPTLRLLTEPLAALSARAQDLLQALSPDLRTRLAAEMVETFAQVGGGALPTVELPTAAIAIGRDAADARRLDARLRAGEPAVIGRIAGDRLLLDLRTVLTADLPDLVRAMSEVSA
jgi:L-seryl-tRNA(Ser) seleniumtransferase